MTTDDRPCVEKTLKQRAKAFDKDNLPVMDEGDEVVQVQVGVAFYSLLAVDNFKGTVDLSIWLRQSWLDPRLTWNPDDYNGVLWTSLDSSYVWTPDLRLYNSAQEKMGLNELDSPAVWAHHVPETNTTRMYWQGGDPPAVPPTI